MGRRSRRRSSGSEAPRASTTDYTDPDGNVLSVRDSISAGTLRKLSEQPARAAATRDDAWQRQGELMFERLVTGWTISGLPLSGQKELLGRYRMADSETRRWVRETLEEHLRSLNQG